MTQYTRQPADVQFGHYFPQLIFRGNFPGNLTHGVETNTTDNERVSVSFNVYIDR